MNTGQLDVAREQIDQAIATLQTARAELDGFRVYDAIGSVSIARLEALAAVIALQNAVTEEAA